MIEPSCRVHVNWEHFRHNIGILMQKEHELMPVIKADAYGHGVAKAAMELERLGIRWAAAGTLREAALVRESGFTGHIVALLSRVPGRDDVALALEKNLVPLIHNKEGLHSVQEESIMIKTVNLQKIFKTEEVQTLALARLGFPLSDMEKVAAFLAEHTNIRPLVQVSHFSVADEPDEDAYTAMQCDIFYRAADIMHRYFPDMRCSLGNTAGLAVQVTKKDDICRPGLALYGYDPMFGTSREGACKGLLPVMEVSAPIISVHPLHKGESLGYGRAYKAASRCRHCLEPRLASLRW